MQAAFNTQKYSNLSLSFSGPGLGRALALRQMEDATEH